MPALDPIVVYGVDGEVQSRHPEAVLVHGVEVQWISVGDDGCADHRLVFRRRRLRPELEWISPRCDDDLLSERHLQVEVASEAVLFAAAV